MRVLSPITMLAALAVTWCMYQWGPSEMAAWFMGLLYGWSITLLWVREGES